MIEKNLKHVQPDLGFVWKKVIFCSTKPKFSFIDNIIVLFCKEKISFAALKWKKNWHMFMSDTTSQYYFGLPLYMFEEDKEDKGTWKKITDEEHKLGRFFFFLT